MDQHPPLPPGALRDLLADRLRHAEQYAAAALEMVRDARKIADELKAKEPNNGQR